MHSVSYITFNLVFRFCFLLEVAVIMFFLLFQENIPMVTTRTRLERKSKVIAWMKTTWLMNT